MKTKILKNELTIVPRAGYIALVDKQDIILKTSLSDNDELRQWAIENGYTVAGSRDITPFPPDVAEKVAALDELGQDAPDWMKR